ncbi:MAG: hypothetical protein LBH32_08680 [Dysgonamonadaceae bacterium]|jgi:hypothetical protein|nr:hypothetical protein [Dysgonamonadaceae bacterium]
MKKTIIPALAISAMFLTACGGNNEPTLDDEGGNYASVVSELGKDADFSLFAAALASANAVSDAESYTIFALPDSIIRIDGDAMSVADVQWHVVSGKYSSEKLLTAQTLKTIGGQTLTVTTDTIEFDDEQQVVLYVNNVPVDYQSVRLPDKTPVYPVGTNIAKISSPVNADNLDAYNSNLALALAGRWRIVKPEYYKYYIWSDGHRDDEPFDHYFDNEFPHKNCYEIFTRNPERAAQGYAGTYMSVHNCGSTFKYSPSRNVQHIDNGWWKVSKGGISFDGGSNSWQKDSFLFDERCFDSNRKLKPRITYTNGRGDDYYYGGDELVITGVFTERIYELKKVQ